MVSAATNIEENEENYLRAEAGRLHSSSLKQFSLSEGIRSRLKHTVTFRGIALLIFSLFLVTGPVPEHSDLFAAVLGYSTLVLIALVSLSTLLLGWWFRTKAQFQLTYEIGGGDPRDDQLFSGRPTAKKPLKLFLKILGANLTPLFSLRVTPLFEHPCRTRSWKIIGSIDKQGYLEQSLTLPHRGRWNLQALHVVFKDTFGLCQFQWKIVSETFPSIAVYPRETYSRNLPIFTAETTSGVEQTELQRTEGDPYDIKRYHPSDGLRRILWKVYAKSGELLSRHPEPSMTPEGVVALHVLAGKEDDELCSLALSHVNMLEDQDYDFVVSADGTIKEQLASTKGDVESLLLSQVWTANECTHQDRTALVGALEAHFVSVRSTTLQRVTFFVSARRLMNEGFLEEMKELQGVLLERKLESLWIILDDRKDEPNSFGQEPKWIRLLFNSKDSEQAEPSADEFDRVISVIANNCELHGFPHIITR